MAGRLQVIVIACHWDARNRAWDCEHARSTPWLWVAPQPMIQRSPESSERCSWYPEAQEPVDVQLPLDLVMQIYRGKAKPQFCRLKVKTESISEHITPQKYSD